MEAENIEFVVTLIFALWTTAPVKLRLPPSRVQLENLNTPGEKSQNFLFEDSIAKI